MEDDPKGALGDDSGAAAHAHVHIGSAPTMGTRRSSLVQALSQGLSARVTALATSLGSYPLARVSAAQVFIDPADFVTEAGVAAWWSAAAHLTTCMFGAGVSPAAACKCCCGL